jgi:hypothetical protein
VGEKERQLVEELFLGEGMSGNKDSNAKWCEKCVAKPCVCELEAQQIHLREDRSTMHEPDNSQILSVHYLCPALGEMIIAPGESGVSFEVGKESHIIFAVVKCECGDTHYIPFIGGN